MGDDPLTVCKTTYTESYQELRFTLGSAVKWDPTQTNLVTPKDASGSTVTYALTDEAMDYFGSISGAITANAVAARIANPGQLRVTYYDQYNGSFTAHGVSNAFTISGAGAGSNDQMSMDALEAALETLPQQKIYNVGVQAAITSASSNGGIDYVLQRRYVVTFFPDTTNSANVGQQNALSCDTGYTCAGAGCQPMIAMPFLYRYAGMDTDTAVGTSLLTVGATGATNINFYTGDQNTDAAWAVGNFIRLHVTSQPSMPFNVPVDTGVSVSSLARYDLRILIAVIDPANNLDDPNDLVYVRTIAGHTNITSNLEALGYSGWPSTPAYTGVWGSTTSPALVGASSPGSTSAKSWTTSLSGFTPLGAIFADDNGQYTMAVPSLPGVLLHFGASNIVHNDGKGRWYEILVKLPDCSVDVLTTDNAFTDINGLTLTPPDSSVESVECSNRGICDRSSGTCGCFQGFYGTACQKQTILV
jgi:hypothetical protein